MRYDKVRVEFVSQGALWEEVQHGILYSQVLRNSLYNYLIQHYMEMDAGFVIELCRALWEGFWRTDTPKEELKGLAEFFSALDPGYSRSLFFWRYRRSLFCMEEDGERSK